MGRGGVMGRAGDRKGAVWRGGRSGKGRGEGGKREGEGGVKGRAGAAFRQIKIYDYTPAKNPFVFQLFSLMTVLPHFPLSHIVF